MNQPPLKDRLNRSEPDAAALERVWSGVRAKDRRRLRPVLGVGLAGVALAAAAGLFLTVRREAPAVDPEVVASTVQLGGGSAVQLEADARFETAPAGGHALALRGGRAHFTLEASSAPWVVTSRYVHLEVASAVFALEVGGETDSVTVTRGALRLSMPGAPEVMLVAGQSFSTGAPPPPSWELLARQGDFQGAWRLLEHGGVLARSAGASPETTMLLSDVAAAGGDEALSRELLRVVVASDGGAERALAAYTLGVRFQTDGHPGDAASAFEQSLELGLPPELQREAHERAVQSWRRAGEPERARRAQERAPAP